MRLKQFTSVIKFGKYTGFSSYFSIGKLKPPHFGKDGPSFRVTFLFFSFCVALVDFENLLSSVLKDLKESDGAIKSLQYRDQLIDSLEDKNQATNKVLDDTRAELNYISYEHCDLKNERDLLSQSIEKFNRKLDGVKTSFDDKEEAYQDRIGDLEVEIEDMDDAVSRSQENEEVLYYCQDEVKTLKKEKEDLSAEVERLEALLQQMSSSSSSSCESSSSYCTLESSSSSESGEYK